MDKLPTLDFDAFRATKHAPSDEEWGILEEEFNIWTGKHGEYRAQRSQCLLYGLPGECFLIVERDGEYEVHAWWYSPIAYDSLEKAEAALFPWRKEWA